MAAGVQLQEILNIVGIGVKPNVDKGRGHRKFVELVRLEVLDQGAVQSLVAPEFLNHMTPKEFDLFILECPLLKNLGAPEFVPPMNESHRVDDPTEVMAFVEGGIPATHDHNVLTAEEVAVAYGAV